MILLLELFRQSLRESKVAAFLNDEYDVSQVDEQSDFINFYFKFYYLALYLFLEINLYEILVRLQYKVIFQI